MGSPKGYKTIDAKTLRGWMITGKDFVLIDTLPGDRFEKIRLPGAKNACVFQVIFPGEIQKLVPQKDRDIVLYGSSSVTQDAVAAAEKLVRMGYQKIIALKGGVAAWQEKGYPLEGKSIEEAAEPGAPFRREDRVYKVDTEKSILEWTGRNPNTKHYGTMGLSKGEIRVKRGIIRGTFEVDMRSIKNINLQGDPLQPLLISHLMSDDFFFVDLFPNAIFTITSAKLISSPSLSAPNFDVKGTLALRGIRKEITFPATVNPGPDGSVSIEAHFDIDRTRWKIIYGSSRFFEHLGMHLVFDLISFQLRILAR